MSQSRLERLQAQADAKPTVSAVAKPYNRKEENKKVLEENRKADHYAFLALEDNIWYYRDRLNLPRGPCPLSTLRTCYVNGLVDENSLVWGQGLEEWVPMRNVRSLPALVRNLETCTMKWWKESTSKIWKKPGNSKVVARPKGAAKTKEVIELNGIETTTGVTAALFATNMLNKGLFKPKPGQVQANPTMTLACMSLALPIMSDKQ